MKTVAYKLVSRYLDRLWSFNFSTSIADYYVRHHEYFGRFTLEYIPNKVVKSIHIGFPKLYVFRSRKSAERYMQRFIKLESVGYRQYTIELWQCEVENAEKYDHRTTASKFWTIPSGTYICDSVKLIKQI